MHDSAWSKDLTVDVDGHGVVSHTCDGAGATLDLVRHITSLNAVPGRRAHYSVGFDLDERARTAITLVNESDWQHVWDREGVPRPSRARTAQGWWS